MKQREKRQMGKPTSRCSSFRRSKLSVAGRNGRNFYSPKGTGLYFSLVTSPKSDLTSAVGITSYAAVCVVEAIKELTGTDTKIKWVNDIYLDGQKAVRNTDGSGIRLWNRYRKQHNNRHRNQSENRHPAWLTQGQGWFFGIRFTD